MVSLQWALVLLAYTALDFVYARWAIASAKRQALAASLWATAMLAFSGFVTISYTQDPWMLVPAAIGAFLGTFIGIKTSPA